MRHDTHTGNNSYIHFRMTEEPEQVLPKKSRPSRVGQQLIIDDQVRRNKEARTSHVIENEQDARRQQNCEGRKAHD